MRRDAVGFFWNDAPVPKPPKPKPERRQPPERTWERPDYLPGLQEAMEFNAPFITDEELMCHAGGEMYFDIEIYPNFYCVGFMSKRTGHVLSFCSSQFHHFDAQRVKWIANNYVLKGFNSWSYDVPMLSFILFGMNEDELHNISQRIVEFDENPSDILREYKLKRFKCNHIDLIEVAPSFSGLKAYGGRMHVPRMQDLPFNPHTVLSEAQMQIVRWYNVNDLVQTWALDHTLEEQQKLRLTISNEIGVDVRSKSDAQIAEAVISEEIFRRTKTRYKRPEIAPGTCYHYQPPAYLQFQTPQMKNLLEQIKQINFVVDHTGRIGTPPELEELKVTIGESTYTMGIGGLHSNEKSRSFRAQGGYKIFERDVESYYPRVMLNQKLYPRHLGEVFLLVFEQIVNRRLHAKRTGDKVTADSLKITINGSFGKLGSPYSLFYAPDLLIQVTLSGQLALLMLVELLEMYGIKVISANTDSITVYVHESQMDVYKQVVAHWENIMRFKTEEVEYVGLFSKDVNNYLAIKPDGKFKGKGLYANPWHQTAKDKSDKLKKNPATTVCVDAVIELLTTGKVLRESIESCRDFTKFVSVRHVTGGAVAGGHYLGKACRWYYSKDPQPEMVSAKSGNKVPKSDGARPCMQLPKELPADIDYEWYVQEAEEILKLIGYA